jgi:hypothetical protein
MLGLLTVTALHMLWTFFVYRERCMGNNLLARSDLILFALPLGIVFISHLYLFRHTYKTFQALSIYGSIALISLCFLTTFLYLWISMLIPINTYGT